MNYNAASRPDVRRAEKAAKLAESNRRTVLATLASSSEGRQYLWDQLASAHIFTTTYVDDPRRSAFLEGERNAGLRLLDDLMTFCPDAFLQMMRDENERRSAAQQPRSPDRDRGVEAGDYPDGGDEAGNGADYDDPGAHPV